MTINATSSDTPLAIPDNTPAGVTSAITVTEAGTIESGTYTIQVTHARPGDLTVYLSDGESTLIAVSSGSPFNEWVSSGGNVQTLTKGMFFFEGQTTDRTWTLNVVDEVSGESGTLDFWSLSMETGSAPGVGDAELGLTADASGYLAESWGAAVLELTADGVGQRGLTGAGSALLSLSGSAAAFVDWVSGLDPVELQEVYRLVVTGAADGLSDLFVGQISSWQATNQAGGRSSYLQAVVPAAEPFLQALEDRQRGELVIQKGLRLSDGSVRYEEILRSRFDTLRPDRGQRALTVTFSGYQPGKPFASGHRKLTGIRSVSAPNGRRRVRCDVDLFLQPGMTVDYLGETFTVGFINYYVSQGDKFCEVGEA